MITQSLKNKKTSSQTECARQTIQSNLLEGILQIPNSLKNRLVEVILLPIDSNKYCNHSNKKTGSHLQRFAGAWCGDQLIREDQGNYEIRETLK